MTSYIYFIRANGDGPIKIGFTTDLPHKRIATVKTGCPWPITLIGAIEGTMAQEKALHRALVAFRTQGEWFQPHPDVLELVNATIKNGIHAPVKSTSAFKPYDPNLSKLENWLRLKGIRPSHFAKTVGVTPAVIFYLTRGENWISRDLAQKIYDATDGEITPTDFLFLTPRSEVAA